MRRVKVSFFPMLLVVAYMLIEGSFDPLLAMHCEPHQRIRLQQWIGLAVLLPLLGLAVWQFLSSGYNLSLLFISIYLLFLIKENGYDV